jgi:deoxyribonuclease V
MPLPVRHPHPWNVSPEEAVAIQQRLREQVIREGPMPGPGTVIVGVDVGFRGELARAAAVAVRFPDLTPLAQAVAEVPVTFPYIPGLLAFREAPAILAALERLPLSPQVLMVDGHGISHPRRMGIATHLGVYLDLPSIGCAKSKLWGRYEMPPDEPGAWSPLWDGEEMIGAVLRTPGRSLPGVRLHRPPDLAGERHRHGDGLCAGPPAAGAHPTGSPGRWRSRRPRRRPSASSVVIRIHRGGRPWLACSSWTMIRMPAG